MSYQVAVLAGDGIGPEVMYEAKKVLDKDGKVNALGPYGKQKLTGREIQVYFRRNKVKDKVVKLLKSHGVYYFYAATHGFGRSGVPDLVCCIKGHFLAIEVKAGKNTTTALQDREIEAIRVAEGTAFVINETNIQQLEDYLNEQGIRDTAG